MDYRPCLHKIFQFFLCLIFMKNWEVGRLHLNCALTTHISWRRNCKWDVDYCLIFFAKRPKLSHSELNSTDHAVERQSLAFCQISFQCRNFWNSLISLVCFSFSLFFIPFVFFCHVSGLIHFSELGFSLIGRQFVFLERKWFTSAFMLVADAIRMKWSLFNYN